MHTRAPGSFVKLMSASQASFVSSRPFSDSTAAHAAAPELLTGPLLPPLEHRGFFSGFGAGTVETPTRAAEPPMLEAPSSADFCLFRKPMAGSAVVLERATSVASLDAEWLPSWQIIAVCLLASSN